MKKADILDGVKVVTSGPSVKERTSTPKEPKESKYKLGFDFADQSETSFLLMADLYSNEERKKRLSTLFAPMLYDTKGFQFSMIVIHAPSYMAELKHHSDHEFNAMIENRNVEECYYDTFDDMLMGDVFTSCRAIEIYAKNLTRDNGKVGVTLEDWAKFLPKNQKEAMFVVQLLFDGGINKYNLSCAGLTENLLKDVIPHIGLETDDEYLKELDADDELAKNSDEWVSSLKN